MKFMIVIAVELFLAVSAALGQWSTPVNISNTDGRYSGHASFEFDAAGKMHMAFYDFLDSSKRVYYANNVGGSWTKTQVKSGGSGPALIITPDQTLHIFYNDGSSTVGISKPVSGGSWSSQVRIDNSQAGGCPAPDPTHPTSYPSSNYFASADGDTTGGIFVTWMSLFNGSFTPRNGIWGRYRSPSGTWGCLELVAGSGDDGNFPGDVHVTHNGSDIYVCWSDRDGCYYRKRASNGIWSNRVTVNDEPGHCRIAFSPTGEWAVTYHEDTGGGASDPWFEIFVRTSTDQGVTWSPEANISNRTGLDRSPTPAYDANGDMYVTWELFDCDGCKAEVYYRSRIGGAWQPRYNLSNRPDGRDGFNYYEEVLKAHNGNLYAVFNSTVDAYEDVFIRQTAPQIDLNTTSINRNTWIGTNLSNDTFTIKNGGTGAINYTVSDNVTWLSVTPAVGASAGEADTLTVQYNVGTFLAGTYNATITAAAPEAWNSPQTLAVSVEINSVAPDFNGDGDVDQDDFAHIQACLTGTAIEQTDPACLDARLDYDGSYNGDKDVDQDDLNLFIGCMSGAGMFANPSCMLP